MIFFKLVVWIKAKSTWIWSTDFGFNKTSHPILVICLLVELLMAAKYSHTSDQPQPYVSYFQSDQNHLPHFHSHQSLVEEMKYFPSIHLQYFYISTEPRKGEKFGKLTENISTITVTTFAMVFLWTTSVDDMLGKLSMNQISSTNDITQLPVRNRCTGKTFIVYVTIQECKKHMFWTFNPSNLQWVVASSPDQLDFIQLSWKGRERLNKATNIAKEQNSENAYNEPGYPNHLTVLPKGYCLESRVVLHAFCAMCMQPSPRSLKMLNAERLLLHINMIARRPLNFYICISFH